MDKEEHCPCAKSDCERHGDCVACHAFHSGKPVPNPTACKRPENASRVPKWLQDRIADRLRELVLAAGAKAP